MQLSAPVSSPFHRPVPLPVSFGAAMPALRKPVADSFKLRFAGAPDAAPARLTDTQKMALLKTAPVDFVDGADFKALADTPEEATRLARQAMISAFKEAMLAGEPGVRGPLPEGWGAAAIVSAGEDDQKKQLRLSDSNINFRTDIKMCAEQNLLDRIVKSPAVRRDKAAGHQPEVSLLANVLQNFDDARYQDSFLTPCNTCLDTFQAVMKDRPGLLTRSTLIASLSVKAREDGKPAVRLELRPLKKFLPASGLLGPSFSTTPLEQMDVVYTASAKKLMAQRQHAKIEDAQVRDTLKAAMSGFAASAQNGWSARGGEYVGVGLLRYPDAPDATPKVTQGSSLHIKNSEPQYAELAALSAAIQHDADVKPALDSTDPNALDDLEKLTRPQKDSHLKSKESMPPLAGGLSMVGFVHRLPDQPRPRLLGLLMDAARQDDFLVTQIRNDRIVVLTASQLLPIQYKSKRSPV